MESITIKLPKEMVKEIDKAVNGNYGTKSEFVRDALRNKLEEERKKRLMVWAKEYRGFFKTNTSDEDLEKIKEKAAKEFFKKRKLK
jgi:Arc/MetJ-type ribon-helix-helix transcriptional regulator